MAQTIACAHHHTMVIKLLVVEDSEPVLTRLLSMLAGVPNIDTILSVGTLAQALETVRLELPNLMILNLQLPDGNAVRHINALKGLSPLMWIVVLSNDTSDFLRDKCMQAGADWFFDKSTEFNMVFDVVCKQAQLHHSFTKPYAHMRRLPPGVTL